MFLFFTEKINIVLFRNWIIIILIDFIIYVVSLSLSSVIYV